LVERLGISILDLLPQTTDLANFVPDEAVEKLGILTVLDHKSSVSDEFILHSGTLQSIGDILGLDAAKASIKIPGLTQGLPFRLAVRRGGPAAGGQEGQPDEWTLDVSVSNVEVLMPGLKGARQAGGVGVTPLHLEKLDPEKKVFLVASGVLRLKGAPGVASTTQLVDSPDPFDPTAPTGAVVRLTVRPPHFLFFSSQYGMTLDRFTLDLSKAITPADVVARGHDETWEGVSFKEATFYTPPDGPILPSLSISARDVIVGDPGGRQGELRVEWGADFADQFNTHIKVFRRPASGDDVEVAQTAPPAGSPFLEYGIDESAAGLTNQVRCTFGVGDAVPGHTDFGVVGVWWQLPDGQEGNTPTTPYFTAPTDKVLKYKLRLGDPGATFEQKTPASTIPEGQTELIEATVRFPRIGAPKPGAPLVDAVIGGATFSNVVHIRGPRERLEGVVLQARRGTAAVEANWLLGVGSAPASANKKTTFSLPKLAEGAGIVDLLASADSGPRRVRIEVVRTGHLVIGHQTGADPATPAVVSVAGLSEVTPSSVVDTFEADGFHTTGDRHAAATSADIAPPNIQVPAGTIAEVEFAFPADTGVIPPPPPEQPVAVKRALQFLFPFEEPELGGTVNIQSVVYPASAEQIEADPEAGKHQEIARPIGVAPTGRDAPAGADIHAKVAKWIDDLPNPNSRRYLVVGRTDDLKFNDNLADNKAYNDSLAGRRRDAAIKALKDCNVTDAEILARIESQPPPPFPTELDGVSLPERFLTAGRLALPPASVQTPSGKSRPAWNSAWTPDGATSEAHAQARDDARRTGYRCADVYAIDAGDIPPPPPPTTDEDHVPTRMLVPGRDGPPPPTIPSTQTQPPPDDYRVRLRAKWDSPTAVDPSDNIPTELELLVAWKAAATELPATNTGSGGPPGSLIPPPTGPDFWELILRLAYDARTEETQLDGSLSLPDGAMTFRSDALAGALAFGPALMALIDPADVSENDPTDAERKFVYAAAILALGVILGEALNEGDGPESTVDIDKFSISYRWNGETRVSATVDYTVDLHINVDLPGDSFLLGKIKLRYKGVGLRFDSSKSGLASVGITYDDLSVDVADPGQWSLGGPLGNLIRVAASRIGNGSTWMEFDLEFALDLGVVRLEGATIRLTLQPFSVELRGLTAVIDIPGTVFGKGSVTVGDAGAIRALLAVTVIPARLGAYGALAIDQDFVAVEVGVQFPVGIPLANTGLGLFGIMGRFVANGARNLDSLTNPDPVQRELDWYARQPDLKYKRQSGQFALGLGAVIGTLPDSAFTFNAEGSLALGFPDVSVLLGIDAHLFQQRKPSATESASTPTSGLRILGMTLFEPDAVMVAVRASYEIPKVVKVNIPFSAFYPLAGSGLAWFIRLGTDNHPDRPGSPITVTVFPSLLNIKAWAFLMIEERGLQGLGGTLVPADILPVLDFDGYAIGMGAGFEYKKKAGPFKLEISAYLLVGVGTKPLLFAGAAGVRGELDLRVVSVGVDGVVHFHITDDLQYVFGHFCGHVSFFFFSVSGCVDIHIGDDVPSDIPKPGSPLLGIDLCDHLSAVKGAASANPATPPVVWPDTVAVLKFQHYVEDALGLPPATPFKRLVSSPAALSPWSGSTELKYAFRLEKLELFKLTGSNPNSDASWTALPGPFDSAWWLPSHRRAVVTGGDEPGPSSEEGRELGLFHWDPRAWSRWLGEGSQDLPGDPAGSVGGACEEPAAADPSCVLGEAARASIGDLAAFDAQPAVGSAFPSRYTATAAAGPGFDPATITAIAGDLGWLYRPAQVATLHGSVHYHNQQITRGWRLPSIWEGAQFVLSAPTNLRFSKPLLQGELLLECCVARAIVSPKPPKVWDAMPTKPAEITAFQGGSGAKYQSARPMTPAQVDGRPVLTLQAKVTAEPPEPVPFVRIDLVVRGKTVVQGLDREGRVVAEQKLEPTGKGDAVQTATLQAAAIARISITAGGSGALARVRWGADEQPLLGEVSILAIPDLPAVIGVTRGGKRVPLQPRIVPIDDPGANTCFKFAYPFDDLGAGFEDGWVAVEIPAHRRGELALVSLCGVTVEARAAQGADGDFRQSLADLLNGLVLHLTTNEPTRSIELDAETTYQVRATWTYQGWRPDAPGDAPPPPAATGWLEGGVDRFTFRTAAVGTSHPLPVLAATLDTDPSQGGPSFDEQVFDPRGLARYVMASTPGPTAAPHFLDDRVGFWFSVDHIASLVDHYDRVPLVKVLRTRPSAGSLHSVPAPPPGGSHPLDVTVATHFALETLTWYQADHRFVVAAADAPCIGQSPPLGSSSVSVDANLLPKQDYDLLMTVAPKVVGAHPEVVVARNHFRTSRYRNPTEFLGALGFQQPVGLAQPFDAIATGPAPAAGPPEIGDDLLDALLSQLGLDPWPLPAGPRTSVVWQRPAGPGAPWAVVGALVEADEPVFRPDFTTGAEGEPTPPPRLEVASLVMRRTTEVLLPSIPLPGRPPRPPRPIRRTLPIGTLTERVRNAAGTRILFLAPGPIPLSGGLAYDLRMTLRERGVDGAAGSLPVYDRPLVVFQEGE
jgi:hypothetical protein